MKTLEAVKRDNISGETYSELQRRFTRDGVETYSDLIIGLPGETYTSFVMGVNELIETGQHNRIQFNNLSILPNAEMGSALYQEQYGIKTVRSEIINIHGERIVLEDDVPEFQDLVISTESTPPEDWRRTRAFSWMAAFLYFDKILQIPLMVTNQTTSIGYGKLIESFVAADSDSYPLIYEISRFFLTEAESIQNGGPEYVFSSDYLGIYWPPDEFMFIKLTVENRLPELYAEAERLLATFFEESNKTSSMPILSDALSINLSLIRQPFVQSDVTVQLDYDMLSFYDGMRVGKPQPIEKRKTVVKVERSKSYYTDLQTWCREVVWWGNKKGAYLHTNQKVDQQLAGHY